MTPYAIMMNKNGAIIKPGSSYSYERPPYLQIPGEPEKGEITVYDVETNDGNAVLTSRQVTAFTYYCDLDADADWDNSLELNGSAVGREECFANRDMSGDGSAANPWKNLTYALEKIQSLAEHLCCERFIRIVCSGEAHYSIMNLTYFYGYDRVIIDGAKIKLTRNNIGGPVFSRGLNTHFYNCSFTINFIDGSSDYETRVYAIDYCNNSKFFNCDISANGTSVLGENVNKYLDVSGITLDNENTLFYECNINAIANASHGTVYAYGSKSSVNAIFANCNISAYSNVADDKGLMSHSTIFAYGLISTSCNIYNCIAYAEAGDNDRVPKNSHAYAYYSNRRGSANGTNYYNSTGTAIAGGGWYATRNEYMTEATAFYYIDYARGCTAIARATTNSEAWSYSTAYGYYSYKTGIDNCSFSVSAGSNCTENDSFREAELECGVCNTLTSTCEAGHRCTIRTNNGTESCDYT